MRFCAEELESIDFGGCLEESEEHRDNRGLKGGPSGLILNRAGCPMIIKGLDSHPHFLIMLLNDREAFYRGTHIVVV